jgi:ABC-type spermidine/putrescine transport system permease subunit II
MSSTPASVPAIALRESPWPRVRSVAGQVASMFFIGLLYLFLYAPLLVIALFSFNDSTTQTLPFEGFTTDWYDEMLGNNALQEAAFYSFKVTMLAVAIGTVFGTGFALVVHRVLNRRTRGVVQGLLAVPVVLPGVVLGISLLVVFRSIDLKPGFLAIVIGHATFVTPIIMFVVLTRLRTMDPALEHASMDLGAGRIRTFINVTLPQLRVALLAGALLGFTISFDEIIVTFFLAGVDVTLPVYVWNQLRFGFTPEINAIFTLIGIGSIVLIVIGTSLLTGTLRGRSGRRTLGAMVDTKSDGVVGGSQESNG